MSWHSQKHDDDPNDPVDGVFNADDYNGLTNHLVKICPPEKEGIIDGGNAGGTD